MLITITLEPPHFLLLLLHLQSPQLAGYIDEESDPAVLRNRQHVYKEMVDTEQVFIDDVKIILDVSLLTTSLPSLPLFTLLFLLLLYTSQSYYYEMEPEERVPLRLRGKRGTIFGNLTDIYDFHSQ